MHHAGLMEVLMSVVRMTEPVDSPSLSLSGLMYSYCNQATCEEHSATQYPIEIQGPAYQ